MRIRAGGGVQPLWIIFKFYNIIIKSAKLNKRGGGNAYPQNVDKKTLFCFNTSLRGLNFLTDPV